MKYLNNLKFLKIFHLNLIISYSFIYILEFLGKVSLNFKVSNKISLK